LSDYDQFGATVFTKNSRGERMRRLKTPCSLGDEIKEANLIARIGKRIQTTVWATSKNNSDSAFKRRTSNYFYLNTLTVPRFVF